MTSTDQHGLLSPTGTACASSPEAELALRMVEGLLGCPSAITGPRHSLQSGLAGHPCHVTGLAEGLLLTADRFGLTVNKKIKSLCRAIQPLLHPPSYKWPRVTVTQGSCTTVSGGQMCSTLVHRVLAGNTNFPLTTNPSGKGKKRSLSRGETEIESCHCQITSKQ